MKREIAKYVPECDTCQKVKASHLMFAGTLQPLPIPSWKWEDISIDIIVGLPNTSHIMILFGLSSIESQKQLTLFQYILNIETDNMQRFTWNVSFAYMMYPR